MGYFKASRRRLSGVPDGTITALARYVSDPRMAQKSETIDRHPRRYPATRTSPWFFIILAATTILFTLAGIFHVDPVTKVLNWLAVVL